MTHCPIPASLAATHSASASEQNTTSSGFIYSHVLENLDIIRGLLLFDAACGDIVMATELFREIALDGFSKEQFLGLTSAGAGAVLSATSE